MKRHAAGLLLILALVLLADAGAQTPPALPAGVTAHRDLAYVTRGHERQALDLYVPAEAAGPTPLIVWIHGGGWSAGDKSGCPPLRAGYVRRGFAVASLNYRLSGDALFPAQLEDCKAALRWLRAHAADYHLDPAQIGVWGSSAGGHLAALLGTTGETRAFDVGENLDQSSAVQAVADFYGPADILQMDAHALPGATLQHDSPQSPEARLIGGPLPQAPFRERAAKANPLTYLTKSTPPFLIVHGDQDGTVPHHQSELLFAALQQAGVAVRFHTIEGAGHGRGFGGGDIDAMVAAFFAYRLLGEKTTAAAWPPAMTSASAAVEPPARPGPAPGANQGAGPRPTWAQLVAREDANHDGTITRAEFKGPAPLFARLDRNGDGALTREEFEAGPPAR